MFILRRNYRLQTLKSVVVSTLHCQVHQGMHQWYVGEKSHGGQSVVFSRALRLGRGCSRVAVRGMGRSCRVAVIPIASVRLGLHSSLTAFQRRTQSQIDNNT